MSDLSERVTATILLADYANVDSGGKANVIGGGVQLLGYDYTQGVTTPFAVFLQLRCAMPSTESEGALEVVLADASGDPVQIPGPLGEPQAMRIAQNIEFHETSIPGLSVPRGALEASSQMALNFPSGLPLPLNQSYQWRVHIDHEVIASYSFFVPGQPSGPVLG